MKEKCPKCGIGSTFENGKCRNGGCGYIEADKARPFQIGSIVCGLVLVLWLFYKPAPPSPEELIAKQAALQEAQEAAWILKGQSSIKYLLKDPESAKFRNVYFYKGKTDTPVTCGEVNAKNSFGAYDGFKRFLSGGRPDLTHIETNTKGFQLLWDKLCN